MSHETPKDSELIYEHLQGSSTAMMQLWMRYDSLVYGLAHSIVCRRDVAEDLRQEVFFKVYTELSKLNDYNKFPSWLKSITYNACIGWIRRQKPFVDPESLVSNEHPIASIEARELRTLLRQMIDKLPEDYRVVIELHYFEEQSVAEIGKFLEIPESTVKWRIHKAREILKQMAKINGYLE